MKMKAAVYHGPKDLRVEEIDVRELKENEVLIRVKYCGVCHNISETDICPICNNPSRDATTVCVVESVKDVMSFENTRQYTGLYHVLGGVISPMDGVGPEQLEIESLVNRIKSGEIKEVILAKGNSAKRAKSA
mgnify:CR=1 FL=1